MQLFRLSTLSVFTVVSLVLCLAALGTSYPLQDEADEAHLRAVKPIDYFHVRFSWHNISCPLCKVIFTVVDIALLVRDEQPLSLSCVTQRSTLKGNSADFSEFLSSSVSEM